VKIPIYTFHRGIHPDGQKNTAGKSIQKIQPKPGELMSFPMLQHLGAPCEPVVTVGEQVFLGQKIADSDKFVSSPIHASVSGVVKEITKTLTPNGNIAQTIIIENDGKDTGLHHKPHAAASHSRDETLALIREGGVVGLGGEGFPTHIKLNPPQDKTVDTIIVNAAECEPYLTTDHRVLLEDTHRLISGLKVILSLFPKAKGIIAIETNKPDALEKLAGATADEPNITTVGLKPKYPQGAEKQLIYAITKREVPSGGLPADIGCIVDNVDTVIAVERAVKRRRPLIRRIITIDGSLAKNPGNYEVRLGMSYRSFIDESGGLSADPYKMISGGPMMGVAMFSLDVPIIKTSSSILCFSELEAALPEERGCIRCGKCADHCPARLMPFELNQYVIHNQPDMFLSHNGLDCIECGSCSYVCPSKRHLAQSIRASRREAMSNRKQ
jgi:electron transport complex protein RnfC